MSIARNREAMIFYAITGFVDLSHLCTQSWHRNAKILKAGKLSCLVIVLPTPLILQLPAWNLHHRCASTSGAF